MLLTVATVALAVTYLACNLNTVQGSIIQPEIITGWKTDASGNTSFQFDRDQRVIKEETENDVTSYVFNRDSMSFPYYYIEHHLSMWQQLSTPRLCMYNGCGTPI